MFRLSEEFKDAIRNKYNSDPIERGGKNIPFSMEALSESIGEFVKGELIKINEGLFLSFTKRKKRPGYSQDNLLRVFSQGTSQRDFIDLLFYYTYGLSYEQTVAAKLVPDQIDSFNKLRIKRRPQIILQANSLAKRIKDRMIAVYCKKIGILYQLDDESIIIEYDDFDVSDLEILKQLPSKKIFGHEIYWDSIERCFEKNKAIVRGIKLMAPTGDELIVGFYIIYPLTKECRQLIEDGTIMKSAQLVPEYICDNFDSAVSIYISYVYGEEGCKSAVLEKLKGELRILLSRHPQITTVYVRPTTDDGKNLVKRHRFSPLKVTEFMFYTSSKELLKGKAILNL